MNEAPRRDRGPRDPASPLVGANIVVAVTGGIAAYKAAELVRLLDKAGAHVEVAMTARAQKFIGAMTFQALTRRPVFTDLFSLTEEAEIGHIQVADRADLVIVAPATANAISRLAAGRANDAVSAIVLATRAPVLLAPSMNVNMWNHPLTASNVRKLVDVARYRVVGPGDGFLACRWTGPGRLAEPADIVEAAAHVLSPQDLTGTRIVVTAGPTYEPIDPVRFVGNRSSGKMGVAIAAAAQRRGATVTLILGPSALTPPVGVATMSVENTAQLQWALADATKDADVVVMTAAVADYRPAKEEKQKLKRGDLGPKATVDLVANPDLLAELGKKRGTKKTPLLVGFAAETDDVIGNAQKKLATKKCDLVVANNVAEAGAGFAVDTNHVTLVDTSGAEDVPTGTKYTVAHRILDRVVAIRKAASQPTGRRGKPATSGKPKGRPRPS
ncbi:MAG: bifunctional phosphopantothenoylcysteine decarboxylase/phosphopantothenate--cysteine ligase CoaBC [Deltaproteobacteria bacterium]|nr:bifunctional phosphopantothenoylcysteine decarboxylase/phosphopantothenate--cysteine ligase CoaBC [Deltaproteobacteria bacterium]MDQ3296826.1 bifunctional phosphopantothenoylcysteine decarboxylase/phosphopantothenate--cysteine ligase CoaBC [Myxococcota bacterium]